MGLRFKLCVGCGKRKPIGQSKKRCKTCRKTQPTKSKTEALNNSETSQGETK